jgi:hypothetical protein
VQVACLCDRSRPMDSSFCERFGFGRGISAGGFVLRPRLESLTAAARATPRRRAMAYAAVVGLQPTARAPPPTQARVLELLAGASEARVPRPRLPSRESTPIPRARNSTAIYAPKYYKKSYKTWPKLNRGRIACARECFPPPLTQNLQLTCVHMSVGGGGKNLSCARIARPPAPVY